MKYILNREALRVVNKDDRGRVTYRKRYRKGQEVDTSYMEDARVEHFVEKGVLVTSEDDLDEPVAATAVPPTSPPFGAATAASVPGEEGPDAEEIEGSDPDGGEEDADDEDEGDDLDPVDDTEDHDVDAYEAMDYAELQQAAKTKGLNAGGSAQDLRARLRAANA